MCLPLGDVLRVDIPLAEVFGMGIGPRIGFRSSVAGPQLVTPGDLRDHLVVWVEARTVVVADVRFLALGFRPLALGSGFVGWDSRFAVFRVAWSAMMTLPACFVSFERVVAMRFGCSVLGFCGTFGCI